jgi:hypothetical protein
VITFVKAFYFRVPKERDIAAPWYLSSKFLWDWDLKPREGGRQRRGGGVRIAVITHGGPNITARDPRDHRKLRAQFLSFL